MTHTLSDYETEEVSNPIMTVQQLGSGWAAVLMVTVTRSDNSKYQDVQDTGFGRYATREEAMTEAKQWAESNNYPIDQSV